MEAPLSPHLVLIYKRLEQLWIWLSGTSISHGYRRVTVYNKNSKVNRTAFLNLDTPYFICISFKNV